MISEERRRAHHCHARGCPTSTKPEMLMCFRHWRMVPKALQRRVWATYRHGQCDDMSPSREWVEAADAAIAAVAMKEARLLGRNHDPATLPKRWLAVLDAVLEDEKRERLTKKMVKLADAIERGEVALELFPSDLRERMVRVLVNACAICGAPPDEPCDRAEHAAHDDGKAPLAPSEWF